MITWPYRDHEARAQTASTLHNEPRNPGLDTRTATDSWDRTRARHKGINKGGVPHIHSSEPFNSTRITCTPLESRIDETLRISFSTTSPLGPAPSFSLGGPLSRPRALSLARSPSFLLVGRSFLARGPTLSRSLCHSFSLAGLRSLTHQAPLSL